MRRVVEKKKKKKKIKSVLTLVRMGQVEMALVLATEKPVAGTCRASLV
jgi:hypothetical protein